MREKGRKMQNNKGKRQGHHFLWLGQHPKTWKLIIHARHALDSWGLRVVTHTNTQRDTTHLSMQKQNLWLQYATDHGPIPSSSLGTLSPKKETSPNLLSRKFNSHYCMSPNDLCYVLCLISLIISQTFLLNTKSNHYLTDRCLLW